MKEMLKNKTVISFMIMVVLISYMNGVNDKKSEQENNKNNIEIVYNETTSL